MFISRNRWKISKISIPANYKINQSTFWRKQNKHSKIMIKLRLTRFCDNGHCTLKQIREKDRSLFFHSSLFKPKTKQMIKTPKSEKSKHTYEGFIQFFVRIFYFSAFRNIIFNYHYQIFAICERRNSIWFSADILCISIVYAFLWQFLFFVFCANVATSIRNHHKIGI